VAPDGSLYLADEGIGRIRRVGPDGIIATVAGGNGQLCASSTAPCGDGGPATQAQLSALFGGLAVAPDGSLYIADVSLYRIRRVGPDGIITTVAGNGQVCAPPTTAPCGDDGPATQASFSLLRGIAVAPDGSLYLADEGNHRIRRVGPDGIIITVAGTGIGGFNPDHDGGLATQAWLNEPFDVVIAPDGSFYIADFGNHRIRRVGPDGIISTVAGTADPNPGGDGGPATQVQVSDPFSVAVAPDGSFYIADFMDHRIRRVGPDGIITTVAGNGQLCAPPAPASCGDDGPATQASFSLLRGIAVAPDGTLYLADSGNNNRIRALRLPLPGFSIGEVAIPAEDGSEVYVFNSMGRHLRTLNALTGALHYQFAYDSAGRLTTITDGDGNVTRVERNAGGIPTAIVAPFGQRTTLSLDANGYLASITNPAAETTQMRYTNNGLLTRFADPKGNVSQMTYDALGRLKLDDDAADGSQILTRTDSANGYEVTRTTALNRATRYQVERLTTGDQLRVNRFPDGTQTQTEIGTNGSRVTTLPDGMVFNLLGKALTRAGACWRHCPRATLLPHRVGWSLLLRPHAR
jgi:YD repeat-containing protein